MALSRSEVRTKVTLEGEREMSRKLKGVETQFKNFGQGVTGAISSLGSLGATAGVVAAGMTVLQAEIRAWGVAIQFAAQQTYELARRAGEVSAVGQAFERIAGPNMLRQLQAVTAGLLDNVTLQQEFTQAARANILTQNELVDAFELVTRAAQDVNQPVAQMIAQFAQAASGGGMEFLASLGVNYAELTERVRASGESMESAEGKALALREGLRMLSEQTAGTNNEAGNTGDALTQMSTALTNVRDAAARAFGENQSLVETISELAAGVERFMPLAVRMANVLGIAVNMAMRNLGVAAGYAEGALRSLDSFIGSFDSQHVYRTLRSDLHDVRTELTDGGEAARRMQQRMRDLRLEFSQMSQGLGGRGFSTIGGAAYPGAPAPSTARGRRIPRDPGSGGGGGGRRPWGMSEREQAIAESAAQQEEALREIDERRRQWARGEWERATREADAAKQAVIDAERDRSDAIMPMRRAMHQEYLDQQRREAEARERQHEQALERLEEEKEKQRELHEERMAWFQVGETAAAGIASQLGEVYARKTADLDQTRKAMQELGKTDEQIEAATKRQAEAADAWRKAQGVAMGIMYGIRAGAEVAEAVASFASQNYPAGALHIVSAGLFTAQSVAAFTELAQSGGGGSSTGMAGASASGGQFRPAPEPTTPTDGGGRTINFFSFGRDYGGFGRVATEAMWMRDRTGQTPSIPSGSRIEA